MSITRVTVAPGHWLAPGPAAALTAALAAGMPADITDAGRTRAEQLALWKKQGHLGLAAHPDDPKAFHMTGQAVDLGTRATAWLLKHPEYGFRRTIKAEWWHFQWFAALATYQEDDMPTAEELWNVTVTRAGKAVPVIQEVADTKTLVLGLTTQIAALAAAVETLGAAVANGDDVDPAVIRDAVTAGVGDALAAIETTVTIRQED